MRTLVPALLIAIFLVAHALVHASFVSPRPPATAGGPQWPFDLSRSWVLDPLGIGAPVARTIGIALLVVVLVGYVLAAVALLGILPDGLFATGVVAGSVASIAMLALFFHPWLVCGLAIDAVLLWAVLAASWSPAPI